MVVLLAGIWIWTWASGVTLGITKPVGGTVIGGGLVCGTHGTTCSAKRTAGDIVELHILTDPGYVFAGFAGDCTAAGQILMNTAKTCVANFKQVAPTATPATRAESLFYEMKAQDVIIARIQEELTRTGSTVSPENLKALQDRRRNLEQLYDEIVSSSYARGFSDRERLILRVTRLLGESDAAAPRDYVSEVNRYIDRWRSTPRFEQAVKRAQDNGYTKTIAAAFIAQQLPPQYFYLAMQESGFTSTAVGPATPFGFPKGMWQFIPEVASRYGLRTGPFASDARVDPQDERMDWEKSTRAAARYIKDIYSTDAQASGLLVMAAYNWGDDHVLSRLKTMPLNPRERNFWTLLAQHPGDVPPQVRDYVFFIVSAAVIGENPRLFGFQFDNPLAFTASR